jgi:hypothetical protein
MNSRDTTTFPDRAMTRHLRTAAVAVALTAFVVAQSASVETARTLLQKRADIWQIITKEKSDWQVGREILVDRIGMARRETESLRARTAEHETNITRADLQNGELEAEKKKLEAASDSLAAPVAALENRLRDLLPRLPAPLRDHVKVMSQRIPGDPVNTAMRLGARFGNLVVILQEIDKWNRGITIVPEMQELSDGTKAEVTAMYLGIGQAYYVSPDEKHAGVGMATAKGWVWQHADEAAPRVRQAIDIYQKKKTAAFVQLPVRIQ